MAARFGDLTSGKSFDQDVRSSGALEGGYVAVVHLELDTLLLDEFREATARHATSSERKQFDLPQRSR